MRNRRAVLAAVAALAGSASVWGLPGTATAAPALDSTVLTYGSVGGSAVGVGDQLSASGSLALTSSVGNVNCPVSTFSATVATNPGAPGAAAENNVNVGTEASSCSVVDMIPVYAVNSIEVATTQATVGSDGTVTVGPITAVANLQSLYGEFGCEYGADSITGTANNSDNSITFTKQRLTQTDGDIICPPAVRLGATYKPATGDSGRLVFVN